MFGNNKPFGTASTFGTSSFGNPTTPFGQNTTTFGAKPATSNVFGTSAFGVATPNAGSLFGSTPAASGTGLFGQPTTAFGAPASTSTGSFGFGATSTGLFGSGTTATQSSGNLFGGNTTSAFGTPRPTFGGFGTTTPGSGLFSQNTNTGTSLFGSTGGFSAAAPAGTTIKFNPPTGTDTMMKGGVSTSIGTRHQCITCMKEYENKSLEELRVEDYAANRKGSATGGIGFGNTAPQTGLFGAPAAASTSAFSFGGTTQAKPLFGTTGGTTSFGGTGSGLFGQTAPNQNTSLFGKTVGFGAATTSAGSAFNFGATTGTSLFGQTNQQKPLFGQNTGSTGLFGNTTTTQATGFGTTTGFGGFGATNQSTGLFGAKPTGFGAANTTTTNSFSFGNTNNMSSGGLFGQKPATTGFGTTTGFGAQPSSFGAFGATQAAGTGLFGQTKPATSVFGGTGSAFGTGLGSSFGNSSFSMGLNANTGTGLFGASNANKAPAFNFGNTGSTGFNFGGSNPGTSTFSFGPTSSVIPGSDPNNSAVLQHAQQQILAMTINPFGDSPLFRNQIKDTTYETEVLKPTNPSAQKALLNDNHYKVALLPTAKIKPKPWSPVPSGKVFLFDGLEDEDPSLSNAAFLPKKSVKKLVLKNIANSQSTLTLTSNISSSQPTRIDVSISLKKPDSHSTSFLGENTPPHPVPLTIDITDSNLETDALGVNENAISNGNEPSLEELHHPETRARLNSSMNDSFAALHTRKQNQQDNTYAWNDSEEYSREKNTSNGDISSINRQSAEATKVVHSTVVILTRSGYYTIPHLDELISLIDEDGNCFVKDFTVGREGYGKVTFPGITDVSGLNLDEIVHFQQKEINMYPDDDKKPPIGEGLNRKAEVTLENVWPIDKTNHSVIKDPERLSRMGYREKIEKSTSRLGATFIDYKPETGSWIFQVEHFSKYGLEDSDEEMDVPKQPENKTKAVLSLNQGEQLNGFAASKDTLPKELLKRKPVASFHSQDEDMEGITSQIHFPKDLELIQDEMFMSEVYSPTRPIFNTNIDVERIQGMKASFFQEDELDEGSWRTSYDTRQGPVFPQKKDAYVKENQVTFSSKTLDVSPNDVKKRHRNLDYGHDRLPSFNLSNQYSEKGVQNSMSSLTISEAKQAEWLSTFPLVKSASQQLMSHQKPVSIIPNKVALKSFKKSVLYNKQHLLADAGYFFGRSFRVGWRADGTFVHLEPPEEENFEETCQRFLYENHMTLHGRPQRKSGFSLSLKKLQNFSSGNNFAAINQKNLIDALELQLENSLSTMDKNAPLFVPKLGVEPIHAHAKLFEDQLKTSDPLVSDSGFIRQCAYVWDLLVSLWGKVRGLDQSETEVSEYSRQMSRRVALSHWLIKTTESVISNKIASYCQPDAYLSKIFLYLSGRRISDAVKLAQQHQDFRLSLLLSQAGGNPIVRKHIGNQLLNWEQNGAYNFIKYNRILLYVLLSGMLMWENVYETVNCCENLDWKQALALHLWYYCNPNASIQDAFEKYEKSFQGIDSCVKYSMPPYPPYIETDELDNSSANATEGQSPEMVYDTCYHILKLYCDRSHRFDLLLMPETYSQDHLDYRLSWLLHLALSSIGHNIPSEITCTLHMNFASELESINLWHWAIFVLLHHSDSQWRVKHVKDILLRHVSLELTEEMREKETFLTEKLMIPSNWIYEAKAIKAHSMGKRAEEAWFLLKAGSWSKSHSIVVKHLAPDAVINEDYDYLLKYLNELALPERSCAILDWSSGGQVYLDYINMCQMVQGVVSLETDAYTIEKFTPQVVSLCNRLSSIPVFSLKDKLSVAEMAKKTATILQSIAFLQARRTKNNSSLTTLASCLRHLPMPHDYAVSENRFVAHCFLEEITTEI